MVILAGTACDLPVIVRVPQLDEGLVNRLLEAGAAGIQLPQVRSRKDVKAFRHAAKYPPEGARSISLAQPAAGYGAEPVSQYIARANNEVLLIGQLESKEVEQPLEQLMPGLDVAFIGTLDLSVDMGFPGRVDEPAVQQRLREIERAATAANVHLGIYADSPARAVQAAAAGYRMIAMSSDLGALAGAVKGWMKEVNSISG
jgi:2-keto-3-deoxy-L-rhamnonate aldolase RhmA